MENTVKSVGMESGVPTPAQKDAKAGIAPLIYVAVAAAAALLSSCQVAKELNNVCPEDDGSK